MRVHVQVVLVKQAALLDMQLDVILIVASRTSAFAVLSRSRQRFWKLASITKALWQPKYNDSLTCMISESTRQASRPLFTTLQILSSIAIQ